MMERNQLWVILILGESSEFAEDRRDSIFYNPLPLPQVISIATSDHTPNLRYYVAVVAAFLLTYWLFIVHLKSQNLYDTSAEQHAFEHSPWLNFIFDVLQLLITYGKREKERGFLPFSTLYHCPPKAC